MLDLEELASVGLVERHGVDHDIETSARRASEGSGLVAIEAQGLATRWGFDRVALRQNDMPAVIDEPARGRAADLARTTDDQRGSRPR